jgi:peptidoglycan hydrolase CwlO-like protein
MSLRSHLQNIDTLIDLQDSRLLALENEFEKDLQTLEDEFEAERLEMIAHHAAESGQLKDIMAAVEADEKDRETDSKHEHEQFRRRVRICI